MNPPSLILSIIKNKIIETKQRKSPILFSKANFQFFEIFDLELVNGDSRFPKGKFMILQ